MRWYNFIGLSILVSSVIGSTLAMSGTIPKWYGIILGILIIFGGFLMLIQLEYPTFKSEEVVE